MVYNEWNDPGQVYIQEITKLGITIGDLEEKIKQLPQGHPDRTRLEAEKRLATDHQIETLIELYKTSGTKH